MQKLKPEIRTKILANALTLFYDKGYEETTMRRIAAKSRMTVGNIYRYFTNKEILFDEVIMEAYEGINALVMTSSGRPMEELMSSEFLAQVLTDFAALCTKYPKHLVIFLMRYLTTGEYPLFTHFEKTVKAVLLASNPSFSAETTELLTFLLLQGVLFTLKNHERDDLMNRLTILFNILFRDSRSIEL